MSAAFDTPQDNPVTYTMTIVVSLGGSAFMTFHTDEVEGGGLADERLLSLVDAVAAIPGGNVQVEVHKIAGTTATSYV